MDMLTLMMARSSPGPQGPVGPDSNAFNPGLRTTNEGLNSFIGAYNFVFDALLTALPTARICMISHFSRDAHDLAGKYHSLIEAQQLIADYWGIPICRLDKQSGWVNRNGHNTILEFCSDGIHPETASFPILGDIVTAWFKSFILSGTGKKFIWYGTSIPARSNSYADLSVTALGGTLSKKAVGSGCIRKFKYNNDALGAPYVSFTDTANDIDYVHDMVDLVGTENEPDYWVFDFGVNDYYADATDFGLFDVRDI